MTSPWRVPLVVWPWGAALTMLASGGCGPKPASTQLRFEAYGRSEQRPLLLAQSFDECAYSQDEHGRVDLVMRARQPSQTEADAELQQVFHARMFWKPVPGTTYVESTQTDATFSYAVVDAGGAIRYDGAGFVFMSASTERDRLTGRIESGTLAGARRRGDLPDVIGQCLVSGEFIARRDPATVVATLSDLKQKVGAAPIYTPRPEDRAIR